MSFIEIQTRYIRFAKYYATFVAGFMVSLMLIPSEALSVNFYPFPRIGFGLFAIPFVYYLYVRSERRNIDTKYANERDSSS